MSFTILSIGVGEGGGKLAESMIACGVNTGAINTNIFDLDALTSVSESKKLLLKISDGGSGKEPNFVKESLKNPELRNKIKDFIKKLLDTTPIFSYCPYCQTKNKLKDSEAVSDSHICIECTQRFSITEITREESVKHNYLLLFVCLGGGSGSGLISDVVDICYHDFQIPIGVIATLPHDGEDTVTKTNALSIFKELYNTYAINGIISPLILVDNQKMFEMYNLPINTMYPTINRSVSRSLDKFNSFSNQVSEYMSTIDTMDTARLWALGGCCTLGKFTVGNSKLAVNARDIKVPHPLDIEGIDEAITKCTFVDGFDLSSAKGVGVIAVAPKHFLEDENTSKCIRYVFGKAKSIIGDGLIFNGLYPDQNSDCLEFYIFFNGLKYPEERFARLWQDIKEGKVISQRKRDRVDEMPYDIKMETNSSGHNFKKLQDMHMGVDTAKPESDYTVISKNETRRDCVNCHKDPQTKVSMGVYKKGGPKPFGGDEKICPICKGRGQL